MNKFQKFREYAPHIGVVAAILIGAVLFGLREGAPKDDGKAGADRWSLPPVPAHIAVPPTDIASVAALFYDDGAGKPKAAKANAADQKWQFVGTARTGNSITAIVVLPKRTGVLRLSQGSQLPGGEQIVAVDNGLMRYTDENGQHELRAFMPPPSPSKEEK